MSFSGKKYRRVRCENVENVMKVANATDDMIRMLKASAPTFSFTRVDDETFSFTLQNNDKIMTHNFRLGEEHDMERRDGSKVKVTYTLEGDNVLSQVIKQPDGKVAHFRREFGEHETKMIITVNGSELQAHVYYEQVE